MTFNYKIKIYTLKTDEHGEQLEQIEKVSEKTCLKISCYFVLYEP